MAHHIGYIQIKIHDGIVRTLIEVDHVPELKKNLVSVGAMDSKGFSCWVEGGVMQIREKREVCVIACDKARKSVNSARVHCDMLCLNYFTSWELCVQ